MSLSRNQSALIQTSRMRRRRCVGLPGELGLEGSGLYPFQLPVGAEPVPHGLEKRSGEPSLFLLAEIAPRKAFPLNPVLFHSLLSHRYFVAASVFLPLTCLINYLTL